MVAARRLAEGGEPRGHADLEHAAEAELEAEREHQENDAELGERVDDLGVGGERHGHVRANEQAGDQVAEDDRLLEALTNHRRQGRDAEYQRECLQKRG